MQNINKDQRVVSRVLWLFVVALLIRSSFAAAGAEQKVDVLRTKTGTYRDVTVTKKTKEWVFILHAKGMVNIKISDLSSDSRRRLGYDGASTGDVNSSATEQDATEADAAEAAAATEPTASTGRSKLKTLHAALISLPGRISELSGNQSARYIALGIMVPVYLFYCLCCRMICRKAHVSPGILVWVPGFQFIPLFRAANLSPILFFIPVLNLVVLLLIWPFKIAQERGKAPWVAILLLLPVTNIFAFLYLAFSDEAPTGMDVGSSSLLVLDPA